MLVIYPAIVHADPEGLWAEFPDLDGCFTQGKDKQELLARASEAMECFILGELEDGHALPKATEPQDIKITEPNTYTSLVQANVDLSKNTKSVRKNLTIPRWLSERAAAANLNLSSVLQQALLKELKIS